MKRLALLAFIWGWSFLFIKVAGEGLSPPTVAFGRVALGSITLHLLLRARGIAMPTDRRTWWLFTAVAFFGSSLPFTMLAWGEQRITSALTAVLNASTPLFTAIAAALMLKDRLRALQAAGLLMGFAGVVVAAGLGGKDLAHSSILGSLAAIGAGVSYGIAFTLVRKYLTEMPSMAAAAGQITMATVLLAPFAVVTSIQSGVHLRPSRVLSIVLLGVFGTGLAYVLSYRIIADLGPTRASLVTYLIPVVAVAVGVLVLDEPFELRQLSGGLLIVAGIAIVSVRIKGRRPPSLVTARAANGAQGGG
jgi:drug/metabolite transporter (DMT)-like permease